MRPGTWRDADWRSPQASAGTPNNTRELARAGKKKPQPRTVGVLLLVEAAGIEPASVTTFNYLIELVASKRPSSRMYQIFVPRQAIMWRKLADNDYMHGCLGLEHQ